MADSPVTVDNRSFRRALISLNGLGKADGRDDLPFPAANAGPAWARVMVQRLGLVQVDSVAAVERAHQHILFSRNRRYKQQDLRTLVENDRSLFESWTHDHSILPVEHFPYWRHYFKRQSRYEVHPGHRAYFEKGNAAQKLVMKRVRKNGPTRPRDIQAQKADFRVQAAGFSAPSVAKIAAEFLWRTGSLGVTRRHGTEKVYDLIEKIIPGAHLNRRVSRAECLEWACVEALKRLGAGSGAQIAHFFDLVSTKEAIAWCERSAKVVTIATEGANGDRGPRSFALKSLLPFLMDPPAPPRKLRLLNPFDPLIRDRKRTLRVFGFDYTNEMFVPPGKRKYGYYVLPIMEGDRFVGRADCKADRKTGVFKLLGLWWEKGVKKRKGRETDLNRALTDLAKFTGTELDSRQNPV